MNQEIFWGAAITKAILKIDLNASNSPNTLNARQLSFTILQRAIRFVSFTLNQLEMLP
jgi:hypothetical protein